MPTLLSKHGIAGIQAAALRSNERSQKKNRFRSCAVSKRIQRARGCGRSKNVEGSAILPQIVRTYAEKVALNRVAEGDQDDCSDQYDQADI
jgi:hypothetical protein